MIVARMPCRGNKRLKPLIDFARKEGWTVVRMDGRLTFTKPGLPPLYAGSTASNRRVYRNARVQQRRTKQAASTHAMTREAHSDG